MNEGEQVSSFLFSFETVQLQQACTSLLGAITLPRTGKQASRDCRRQESLLCSQPLAGHMEVYTAFFRL